MKSFETLTIKAIQQNGAYEISELFHEQTKLNYTTAIRFTNRINHAFQNKDFVIAAPHAFKSYDGATKITLPSPDTLKGLSKLPLHEVVLARRTVRAFKEQATVSLPQLSYVLYYSYGITREVFNTNESQSLYLRAAPSAGGLYPCEIYLMINSIEGVQPGLYHYNVKQHVLECLYTDDLRDMIGYLSAHAEELKNAQVLLFITAIFPRTQFKYGERGYRFVHLDAGHLAQNLMLSSTAIGLGSFACGGYLDDRVNQLLNVDGVSESIVYEMAIGIPSD